MPTDNEVATRRASSSSLSQSLPWFSAAMLVVVASILVAGWLDATAAKVDRDTLERGADAIKTNIEEQIRILALAGTGAQAFLGDSLDEIDLAPLLAQVDYSVLSAFLGIVAYPVEADGVGAGEFFFLDLEPSNQQIPSIDVTRSEVDRLLATGDALLSAPMPSADGGRYDYAVALPVEVDSGLELIGVIFRVDTVLKNAIEGVGEGQYAASAVDPRYGSQAVATINAAAGGMTTTRSPSGLEGSIDVVVTPAAEFPFSRSHWITGLVLGVGLLVALLLVWMARMAQARAADLAERLRLAHELNESKDRFLATVSHELRTPLTVVLGAAAEAGSHWESLDSGHRQELLAMMTEQAHEASNIVEDLLVAARSDPAKLRFAVESTQLAAHVEYALASLPKDSLSRIRWDRSQQTVHADSTRLRQILRNLLENAVKYGGSDIGIHTWEADGYVRIDVRDNGPGVVGADLERIFEPYEQSADASPESPTGVGIGLYVSRLLARLMGGDLECIQTAGETNFRLVLPVGTATVDPEQEGVVPPVKVSATG